MRFYLLLALSLCFLDSTAEEYALEKQIITGQQTNTSLQVVTFTHEKFAGKYQSLADFLQQQAGVQVRSSGIGIPPSISIRGSSHQQIKFIVDGHEINDAQYGGFDLNKIPLQQIESIQIIQGNSAAHVNGNAVGGTVLIQTLSAQKQNKTKLFSSIASYETHSYGLTHYFTNSGTGLVSIDRLMSKGDYKYLVSSPTSTPNESKVDSLNNNDFDKTSALIKWQVNSSNEQTIAIKALYSKSQKNIPNYQQNRDDNHANLQSNEWEFQSYLDKTINFNWHIKSDFSAIEKNELYDNKEGKTGIGYDLTAYETQIYNFKQSLDYKNKNYNIGSYYSLIQEQFSDDNRLFDDSKKCIVQVTTLCDTVSKQTTHKVGTAVSWISDKVTDELTFSGEIIQINRSRKDLQGIQTTTEKDNQYSTLAGQYTNSLLDDVQLSITLGKGLRAPTLYELFGNRGLTKSNLALKPEESNNVDINITWQQSNLELANSFFYRDLKNVIVGNSSNGVVTHTNMSSAQVLGIQTRTVYRKNAYSINLYMQFMDSLTKSNQKSFNNKKLSGVFHQSFNLSFTYQVNDKLLAEYNIEDDQILFNENSNSAEHDGRNVNNFRLSFIERNLDMTFSISNIFNEKNQDQFERPEPGRSYSINFNYQL